MTDDDALWAELVRLVTELDPVPRGLVERVRRRVVAELPRGDNPWAA